MANDGNPFERVTATHRRPRFVVEPAVIGWEAVAFRLVGDREAVACIPRRALAGFFSDLDAGKLDTPIERFLASPAAGRVLSASEQTSEPGLFDELASAGAMAAAERGPDLRRGFGRGGGTPADSRRDKGSRRPRRVPATAALVAVAVAVVATAAAVFALTRGGDHDKVVAARAGVTNTTAVGPPIAAADPCNGPFKNVTSDLDGNPTGWTSTGSAPVRVTAPSGQTFLGANDGGLGQFSNETVRLSLDGLAMTAGQSPCRVQVSFRLYLIRSWDGNTVDFQGSIVGPDIFAFDVNGGSPVLSTTFTNFPQFTQNHCPAQSAPCSGKTGIAAEATLGYPALGEGAAGDTAYDFVFEIPYTADAIVLNFTGSGLQASDTESWGLGNIVVGVR